MQLSAILDHVAELEELDVSGVEPMTHALAAGEVRAAARGRGPAGPRPGRGARRTRRRARGPASRSRGSSSERPAPSSPPSRSARRATGSRRARGLVARARRRLARPHRGDRRPRRRVPQGHRRAGARGRRRRGRRARARGERRSALDGVPVAVKDIFLTKGVETTAGVADPRGLRPALRRDGGRAARARPARSSSASSTWTSSRWARRTRTAPTSRCTNPYDLARDPGRQLGRQRRGGGGAAGARLARHRHRRLDPAAGRLLRRRRPEADLRPRLALRRHRLRLVARPGRARSARTVEDAALLLGRIAGHDPRDMTSSARPVDDYLAALEDGARGLRIGVPREWFQGGVDAGRRAVGARRARGVREARRDARRGLAAAHALRHRRLLPHRDRRGVVEPRPLRRRPLRPARARRQGLKEMYAETRERGFGAEPKRRIMLGTYALSRRLLRRLLPARAEGPHARPARLRRGVPRLRRGRRPGGADGRVPARREDRRTRCRCTSPTSSPSPATSPRCRACRCPAGSRRERDAGRAPARRPALRRGDAAPRRARARARGRGRRRRRRRWGRP